MTDNTARKVHEGEPELPPQGKRIKLARIEKGWSQKQLADAVEGLSQAQLSKYESGKVSPTGDVVDKILKAMGRSFALDAIDGVLGIQGRASGKLLVIDPTAPPVPVEWIVEGFVARGFLTMIAGQPGAGKSMVSQTIASALVEGRDTIAGFGLLPRYIFAACDGGDTCTATEDAWHRCGRCLTHLRSFKNDDPLRKHVEHCDGEHDDWTGAPAHWHQRNDTRALILDAENGENIIQERAQAQGLSKDDADRYIVAASDGFDIYKDRAVLDGVLADYRDAGTPVDLIVIDSWTSLWFGNENVVEQVQGCLKYLNELARRFAVGILLIHHTDKEGDSYRGSSAIAATIGGGVFAFSRYDDKDGEDFTARRMVCQKLRIAREPETRKLYITGHGVDDKPETSQENIALSVAERDTARRRDIDTDDLED